MKRTLENNKFSMTYAYVNVKIKKAAKKLNAFGLACGPNYLKVKKDYYDLTNFSAKLFGLSHKRY